MVEHQYSADRGSKDSGVDVIGTEIGSLWVILIDRVGGHSDSRHIFVIIGAKMWVSLLAMLRLPLD